MFEYIETNEHYKKVVEGIMLGARHRLDISTANVKALQIISGKKSRNIVDFFRERAGEGLRIRVLHSGVPSEYFLRLARKSVLPKTFAMRRCPRVHQKTILADDRLLYIGSANLTGAGIGAKSPNRRNFEVGILTDERAFIDKVSSLFEMIWCGDMCPTCGRRKFCPVPLEEI